MAEGDQNQATRRFKSLTTSNWLEPDPVSSIFVKLSQTDGSIGPVSGEDWLKQFLFPVLNESVPEEIRVLFEVARGALAYGYFFYPLYTLAGEQLYRVAEAAISAKCAMLPAPKKLWTFKHKIDFLVERNVIPSDELSTWNAIRKLRNMASHPERQSIRPPGEIAMTMERIAEKVNSLFG